MVDTQAIRIYHNPRCSTSRTVLGMLTDSGVDPEVVEYLKTGWTREVLDEILARSGLAPKDILRRKEALAQDLRLDAASDKAILDAMIANPILVERPIVVTARGAVVCRPTERVWEVVERR
ncbi:MAG TPA: arsenate reductase (glutaredoxin) [Caulobacteraceae bacterium]|jgi:arsenate reductase|nr:arsenate reductase (glutaredoxin) [Caulobacteraceae bacterium]